MVNPVHNLFDVIDCLVDISDDDDLSVGVDLGGRILTGIIMPASFTTADLTFQVKTRSADSYLPVYDDSSTPALVTIAGAQQARHYGLSNNGLWASVRFVKIALSVAQGADRTILLVAGKLPS